MWGEREGGEGEGRERERRLVFIESTRSSSWTLKEIASMDTHERKHATHAHTPWRPRARRMADSTRLLLMERSSAGGAGMKKSLITVCRRPPPVLFCVCVCVRVHKCICMPVCTCGANVLACVCMYVCLRAACSCLEERREREVGAQEVPPSSKSENSTPEAEEH